MSSEATPDGAAPPSLRDQQRQVARTRILDAAAEEVLDRGLPGFGIPGVAERAGVSLRTVYNHFPTKDAVLEGLVAELDRRADALGAVDVERRLDHMAAAVRRNFAVWDQLGTLPVAANAVRMEWSRRRGVIGVQSSNTEMTRALADAVREVSPDLDQQQLAAVTAVLRVVVSSDTWHRLTQEFGLDGDRAGAATGWAFDVLRRALEDGRHPFREDAVEHVAGGAAAGSPSPPT